MKRIPVLTLSTALVASASITAAQAQPSAPLAKSAEVTVGMIWDDRAFLLVIGLLVFGAIAGALVAFVITRKAKLRVEAAKTRDGAASQAFPVAAPETSQLHFAAATLTGLGLIFLFSMVMYQWSTQPNDRAKEIFDACKTIIPPIATLVLGYYFGKGSSGTGAAATGTVAVTPATQVSGTATPGTGTPRP
jgi:hypothetical protein